MSSISNSSQGLELSLLNEIEPDPLLASYEDKKYCCDIVKTKVNDCRSSNITLRILSLTCFMMAGFTFWARTENNYTEGEYDHSLGRYEDGRYISATVLSTLGGFFSTAATLFFAQSTCTPYTLNQIFKIMSYALPFASTVLIEEELNAIDKNYDVTEPDIYEISYGGMFFALGAFGALFFFKAWNTSQVNNALDLRELDSTRVEENQEKESSEEEKISHSVVIKQINPNTDLKHLHHPLLTEKEIRTLPLMITSIKTFKIWVGVEFLVGAGCVTMGLLSERFEQINISQNFYLDDDNGQAYLFKLGGAYFTALSVSNLFHFYLYRSFKKFQKKVSLDPNISTHSFSNVVKANIRNGLGITSSPTWVFLLAFSVHNWALCFFSFAFYHYRGAYEYSQYVAGHAPTNAAAPRADASVIAACEIKPKRRRICCLGYRRIPNSKKEWKGLYHRNFNEILLGFQSASVLCLTTWYFTNTVIAARDNSSYVKLATAATATASLPAWFGLKVWIDLTSKKGSSLFARIKREIDYRLNYNMGSVLLTGLLISQLYNRFNSRQEQLETTDLDYVANMLAMGILTSSFALGGTAYEALVLQLIKAAAIKMSKGDH